MSTVLSHHHLVPTSLPRASTTSGQHYIVWHRVVLALSSSAQRERDGETERRGQRQEADRTDRDRDHED